MLRVSTLFLIFLVLLLLLFPAAVGSFSAVHGPVTAMRANRMAQTIHAKLAAKIVPASPSPMLQVFSLDADWMRISPEHPAAPLIPVALRC